MQQELGGLDELVLSDRVLRPGPRRAPVRTPLSPPHASSRHAVPAPRRRDRRPAARVPRGGAGLPPGGHRPLREAPQRRVHGQERPERRHGPRRRPGLRRRHEAADQDRRRRQHRRREIQDVRLRLGARAASARGARGGLRRGAPAAPRGRRRARTAPGFRRSRRAPSRASGSRAATSTATRSSRTRRSPPTSTCPPSSSTAPCSRRTRSTRPSRTTKRSRRSCPRPRRRPESPLPITTLSFGLDDGVP